MSQYPAKSALYVGQIIAGSGVTVSPPNGTGIVTISVGGTENPTAIVGGANPFPITGEAAASATSAGGAIQVKGAAGGSTSGTGGQASVVGGAGTAGNSAGGAGVVQGGAGQGSAAGGGADVTGGTGGATGNGGPAIVTGGTAGATSGTGGAASVTGGNSPLAGSGGPAELIGGAGGTSSGNGGQAQVTGGAAGTGSGGNGGDVVLTGGAPDGAGISGNVVNRGTVSIVHQGAAAVHSATATLAASDLLAGIIQSAPSAAITLTLPLATAIDAAIPNAVAGDAFDFSVVNTSGTAGDSVTIATATGWTLVGNLVVPGLTAGPGTSGRFRAAKTGTGAWTLFRLA